MLLTHDFILTIPYVRLGRGGLTATIKKGDELWLSRRGVTGKAQAFRNGSQAIHEWRIAADFRLVRASTGHAGTDA
jgi:hypothetical protein